MLRSLIISATASLLLAGAAHAQAISESGDAGETLATAQVINGGVNSISGTLSNLGTGSPMDDIDLSRFFISNPDLFSVTVTSALSGDNDSQLFLFDSVGQLVASDDDSGEGLLAQFNAGVIAGRAPGNFFLAFNLFNTDPVLTDGMLTGWNRRPNPFQTGSYTLNITGAGGAVPEPASWALMIMGFGAVGFAMRRRAKVSARIRFA